MAKSADSKGRAINSRKHPAGTRLLLRTGLYSGEPYEATVVEWSPGNRVCLRMTTGIELWIDRPPFLVEVLPPPITAGEIFTGPDSDALWEAISTANAIPELRAALYKLACACQELEAWHAR